MNRKKGIAHILTAAFFLLGSAIVFIVRDGYKNDWGNRFKVDYETNLALCMFIGVGLVVAGICDLIIALVLMNTPDKGAQEKAEDAKMKKCPACGRFIPVEAAFCKYCGTNINEFESNACTEGQTLRCPECNEIIDHDSEFCQHCGANLKGADKEYEVDTDELIEAEDDETVVCAFCLKPTSRKYLYCQHCKRRRD